MFITDAIDAAGKKTQAKPMKKSAAVSVNDDYALKLADLMDKQASDNSSGTPDSLTTAILDNIVDEGNKASQIQEIRSKLTEKGVLK